MEKKIFDLLEKMYGEIQDVKNDIARVEKNLHKDIVKIENKLDEQTKVLHDGYKQCYEGITELSSDFKNLSNKVESNEIKLVELDEIKLKIIK